MPGYRSLPCPTAETWSLINHYSSYQRYWVIQPYSCSYIMLLLSKCCKTYLHTLDWDCGPRFSQINVCTFPLALSFFRKNWSWAVTTHLVAILPGDRRISLSPAGLTWRLTPALSCRSPPGRISLSLDVVLCSFPCRVCPFCPYPWLPTLYPSLRALHLAFYICMGYGLMRFHWPWRLLPSLSLHKFEEVFT